MCKTIQKTLAAAAFALSAAALPGPAALADDTDLTTDCHTVTLDREQDHSFSRSYVDKEAGLVVVKSNQTFVDLYVMNEDEEVICESVSQGQEEQSCIWIADGEQSYRVKVVNAYTNDSEEESSGDGVAQGDDGHGSDHDATSRVCFIAEE